MPKKPMQALAMLEAKRGKNPPRGVGIYRSKAA
jgi:hypothetical protein